MPALSMVDRWARPLAAAGAALAFTACAGSSSGGAPADRPPVITAFTVAQATATVGASFAVSGTATDPDGDAVTYAWTATPSGCGTFAAAAAASTTFTAAAVGTCTVRLTATANALTATQSGAVTIGAACTGSCGPTHHEAWDPLTAAVPNGGTVSPNDTGSRAVIVEDRAAGAAGDLVGLFYAQGGTGAAWYLLHSPDAGATWEYLAATNPGFAAANPDAQPWSYALAQDTDPSGGKVHVVWSGNDAGAASPVLYSRLALARDGGGHVSGWSWEARNVAGPTFDTSGSWSGFTKVEVKEILDGSGNHLLAVVGMDQPSDTCIQRLRICRTVAGATALAPSGTADWRKATASTVQGCDVVASYSTGGAVDPACGGALTGLTGQSFDWMREHQADFAFAQQPADRSLHLFDGPMYYNDAFSSANPGDIRRWRLAASGANWVNDAGVNGAVLASGDGTTRATLGAAYATASHIWLVYGEPAHGMHIGRSEAGSGWTVDAVPSPDPTAHVWWWTALSVNADETRVYAYWETWNNATYNAWIDRSGYYDGSTWTVADETSTFGRDPAYQGNASYSAGATSWTPIQLGSGVGVMCYPYSQWLGTPTYHLHVLH